MPFPVSSYLLIASALLSIGILLTVARNHRASAATPRWWLGAAVILFGGVLVPLMTLFGTLPLIAALLGMASVLATIWLWSVRPPAQRDAPSVVWGLHTAWTQLMREVSDPLDSSDLERVRSAIDDVDRWRSPETDEFIDLAQEELRDWLTGKMSAPDGNSGRSRRMQALARTMWPASEET